MNGLESPNQIVHRPSPPVQRRFQTRTFGPRTLGIGLGSFVAIGLCLASPRLSAAQDSQGIAAAAAIERAIIDVIGRVEPAVVSVARVRTTSTPLRFNPFDIDLDGREPGPETPDFVPNEFGAGIVLAPFRGSESRFILTNYHVIRGGPTVGAVVKPGESQLYVRFGDRRGYYARILAADPRSDLAVLSVDYGALGLKAADLKSLPLRPDLSPLQKGQLVLALGNPYAIARDGAASVSWGIISNVSRRPVPMRQRDAGPPRTETIHQFGTLLQVDTRLELGTSGGPLVDLHGDLIGVTTSLAALEGYEKSVGFAIPIDQFSRRVIDSLCHGYEVEYGFLGLTPRTILPEQLRRYRTDFKQASAVLAISVIKNSPAARAQLHTNDVILEVDGHPLLDQYDLMRYVGTYGPEATVRLKIWRPTESRELTLSAKLGKWPVVEDDAIIATSQRFPVWRGITVDYPTGRSKYIPWPIEFKDAVVVTNVVARSPAQAAGLTEGDFIASVGSTPVRTPAEFHEAARHFDGEVTLELSDRRHVTVDK